MSPLGHKTGTALIVRPGPSKISYRLLRAWKKAWVRRMVMVAMPLGLLAGGGLWLGIQPGVQKWVGTRCAALIDTFVQRSEFTVSGVAIQGASDRLRARILATVSPDLGTSSLVFDIDAIQARVLTVGGVRSANLRLDGRGILHIAVQERTARALWRDDENRLWCVDANGVIIEPAASRAAYPRLPVVMGDGAQAAIASALALLHAAPDLVPHLRALVRVGQRRWDMVLDRGIRIQLPETAPEIALARVMALQYGEELLERDLSVIDMRLDARPSLRLNEDALETYRLQNAVEAGGEEYMNFARLEAYRNMRARLHTAIKRGRLAVLDIGSSKITCLILKFNPARIAEANANDRLGTSLYGAIEIVGGRMVQSRGVHRGEIVDMDEASRAIRQALLSAEKMAAPQVERVDHAIVSFSGGDPRSYCTMGEVETETGQVSERDLSNMLAACDDPPIGPDHQILHAQPVEIALDYQRGITDPRGMTARKLSGACHVLSVARRPLANLIECVRQCDLDLAGVVSSAYASGMAALVEDEQRTGAVCIDMGGGGTSLSVFLRDHLICVEHIHLGGEHVTADIAAGLMMSHSRAERMKTYHGGVVSTGADDREMLDAPRLGEEDNPAPRQISRGMLIGVIRPRLEETFRLIRARLSELGVHDMPGCGIVLTGAASQMPGVDDLATRILGRRPRIGRPLRIAGLPQNLSGPDHASVVGLAIYALRPHDEVWDFEPPRRLNARSRASDVFRWIRQTW